MTILCGHFQRQSRYIAQMPCSHGLSPEWIDHKHNQGVYRRPETTRSFSLQECLSMILTDTHMNAGAHTLVVSITDRSDTVLDFVSFSGMMCALAFSPARRKISIDLAAARPLTAPAGP
jgi:hypothetical protein